MTKIQRILAGEGEDDFVTLVRQYADMGYSRYATARRILGVTEDLIMSHAPDVVFKRRGESGYTHWDDRSDTAAAVLQSRIKNKTLRFLTWRGETLHLAEWANKTGINATTIARRLVYGWTVGDALAVPVNSRRGAKRPSRKPVGDDARRKPMEAMWLR